MPIRIAAAIALGAVLAAGDAGAQMPMNHASHHHGAATMAPAANPPQATMPGQDAFGTIQEIVGILDADPNTDWSKVDIEALRQHLIDMDEVTLRARAMATPVDGGARFDVTGEGRTLEAIQRMVPAHSREIDGLNGWSAKAEPSATGATLIVTSADPKQTARIRGLGFIGVMAQGAHHQAHHLAMARGGFHH